MVINDTIKIAIEPLEDHAHLWIQECIDDIVGEMTFSEKRAWVTARNSEFRIMPGEEYREYKWVEEYLVWSGGSSPEPQYDETTITTIIEMPALSAICKRLELYQS